MDPFDVDPDIRVARTPSAGVYRERAWYDRMRERVLTRTWHLVADRADLPRGHAVPVTLLEGSLDEPLLLIDGDDGLIGMSNVCTHRAALLVERPCRIERALRCRYHGRRFGLDGRCLGMPEFEDAIGFPAAEDDLARVSVETWGPFVFASLDPAMPFAELMASVRDRLPLPVDDLRLDPAGTRQFEVRANWLLWCENYLEGFHIPFVHPKLARAVDYRTYRTELDRWTSVQVARSADGIAFEGPGEPIGGLYFTVFPTTMLNFYPWGLSLNLVRPLGPDRTRVEYRTYVWREDLRDRGAGADLDAVEHEDDAIVESVHRGLASRLYRGGRYSPSRETGVHHFHRLIAELL